ncbi:MAG: M23 family metallopeptidase [Candidatus Pacebacteria bacterium]|nr:M23 family metallopeptidase [Candidatus Paceibacterota bacterium]
MIIFKISLGHKELFMRFGPKRGRPKKTLISSVKKFVSHLRKVFLDNRFKGNRISRVLRRILEFKKINKITGFNLAMVAFISGTLISPISLPGQFEPGESEILTVNEVKVTTERSLNRPLDSLNVSQGYHFFHRAIDLRETIGTPIYSIYKGRVKSIVYSQVGYGNHLIIDHGSGRESLYAHLGTILVIDGQTVDQNTVLGTVGVSGLTTGPHLHFEIHQNGQPINPLSFLQGKN